MQESTVSKIITKFLLFFDTSVFVSKIVSRIITVFTIKFSKKI